ncbi:PREDICTED: UBX domain-containing protein 6 isoform X2 [Bactrocera latifrons]|uniref:UBX domain-containing protein 6 isoform X2 n=1 Tax=Bactrocera latifrons TaxID=174628 RepID=UPI0008DE2EB4|nr:PREDICTED: UBX domain-containing protein 6 isoform X2 [Bactrocera latifrons]
MSKIKKFFSRKKEEAAFKLKLGGGMGQGRTLNAAPSPPNSSNSKSGNVYVPPKRQEMSSEARQAALAALARIEKRETKDFNTSLAAIKAQAKRELEAEQKLRTEELSVSSGPSSTTTKRNMACEGVFFRCPLISEEILSRKDWKIKIKEFLYQQLDSERALTACLIICNCNTREKADDCIQTLSKYLENIYNHPEEEKYYKIRMSNKIFNEKVRYVEGALDFLLAAGFREIDIDDALKNAETIQLDLDRNIRVLMPSQARSAELPDDFYRISPAEIKREQQLRSEAIENSQVLRTKAMREREEQRNLRLYRFALIRVKFPNGIYIQGTFNVYEKIRDIYEFVQSCLIDENLDFNLVTANGVKFTDEDMEKTLYDLRLIPNIVLLFTIPGATTSLASDTNFLKEEFLMLV